MSMKNSSKTIGNRTRDIPIWSAVPQPTAPPGAPYNWLYPWIYFKIKWYNIISLNIRIFLCVPKYTHLSLWKTESLRNHTPYNTSVVTPQRTQCACIRKTRKLILFSIIIGSYYNKNIEHKIHSQNKAFLGLYKLLNQLFALVQIVGLITYIYPDLLHGITMKIISAQLAKNSNIYKNTKLKLLKTNAAI